MALALRAAAAFAFAILQTQSGSPAMKPQAPRNDEQNALADTCLSGSLIAHFLLRLRASCNFAYFRNT